MGFLKKLGVKKAKELSDLGFSSDPNFISKAINKDGSFNVKKIGLPKWQIDEIYTELVLMSWSRFFLIVISLFIGVNAFFGLLYIIVGIETLDGIRASTPMEYFFESFFFSSQTLTSVGYGRINPVGFLANFIGMIESMIGVFTFAIITGLLYGRFSKAKSKIKYSENALISPYKDGQGIMLRVVNMKKRELVEVEAVMIISFNDTASETPKRHFYNAKLERPKISFFPLTWTIVHPIDEESPVYSLKAEDYQELDLEVLVNIQGYDEISGQTVYSRYSYRYEEIIWYAKFTPAFEQGKDGSVVYINKINDYKMVPEESFKELSGMRK